MSDRSPDRGVAPVRLVARSPDAIAVRALTKRFPARPYLFRPELGPPVLSDVSFIVRFGEVFGILGPNGAGKTTLLEILATLIEPTSGVAAVCGHDVVADAAAARCCLAYSGAAAHAFYPHLTGARNLEFFAVLNHVARPEARQRAATLLEEVGLAGAGRRLFQTYSEGMKQRLSLARALAADPAVLLLDEPTRSLDRVFRHAFHALLRRWIGEEPRRAVLLVTHSLTEAETVCDRVCVLDRGAVAWMGPARAVRAAGVLDLAPHESSAVISGG
jgi:ABC-2 type transport system ATP-binding protein